MIRIFIAVDLSSESKKEIERLFKKKLFKKHWTVKWEEIDKLHLTIAFLGWIKKSQLQLIKLSVMQVAKTMKPFMIKFKGLGCFPTYDWPRIIWLGLKGDLKSLAKCYQDIGNRLTKEGFILDQKPFSPHITLGRIKKAKFKERKEIGRQLKNLRIIDLTSQILVDRLVIYESELFSKGPVYRKIEEIKFSNQQSPINNY